MRPLRKTFVPAGEQVMLPGGHTVVMRPIDPTDGPLLLDGFERLSFDSRRLRFLGAKNVLSPHEVRYLTNVDHVDHEAVVAVDLGGRGVGVARFTRDPERPTRAEVAIVVVDEWQRRGVGTQLMARIAQRADAEGISCFTALIADDNRAVVRLIRAAGGRMAVTAIEIGTIRFTVPVAYLLHEPVRADHLLPTPC